jgi:hypothetical protein
MLELQHLTMIKMVIFQLWKEYQCQMKIKSLTKQNHEPMYYIFEKAFLVSNQSIYKWDIQLPTEQ